MLHSQYVVNTIFLLYIIINYTFLRGVFIRFFLEHIKYGDRVQTENVDDKGSVKGLRTPGSCWIKCNTLIERKKINNALIGIRCLWLIHLAGYIPYTRKLIFSPGTVEGLQE